MTLHSLTTGASPAGLLEVDDVDVVVAVAAELDVVGVDVAEHVVVGRRSFS